MKLANINGLLCLKNNRTKKNRKLDYAVKTHIYRKISIKTNLILLLTEHVIDTFEWKVSRTTQIFCVPSSICIKYKCIT